MSISTKWAGANQGQPGQYQQLSTNQGQSGIIWLNWANLGQIGSNGERVSYSQSESTNANQSQAGSIVTTGAK